MSFIPFQANSGSTSGKTVLVTANATPSSVSGTVDSTNGFAPSMLVVNSGTVLVFVRMSGESPPTATAADIPFVAGASRVLANPEPIGKTGIAVLSSTTAAAAVYFTPGNGGIS